MSKLAQLVAEFCPNEIEYKTLGEIAVDMYRGAGIKRDEVTKDGIPCVRYGEIYTTYGIWFDTCISHTQSGTKFFEHGDILFAITGESVTEIAKSCAYMGYEKCLAGGDIVVMKHKQDPKYIAYALSTGDAQTQKSKGKVKSKVVHSSVPALKAITIPIPPLPIQREIVRILDNFKELTAELTAELIERKKQYEYYRNELLTFGDNVSMVLLGDVCKFQNGFAFKSSLFNLAGSPIIRITNIQSTNVDVESVMRFNKEDYKESLSQFEIRRGDILIAMSGATTGKVGYVNSEGVFYLNQRVGKFVPETGYLNNRFLYHFLLLKENDIYNMAGGGAQPNLSSVRLMRELTIPLLSLHEQERIVATLDKFDALTTDISSGLPAEIEARNKQYAYYRDTLLSFKEVGA